MKLGRIDLGHTVKEVVLHTMRDDVPGLAAELAYRFFLSMFPFFIALAALGGFVAAMLAVEDPTQEILGMVGEALPPGAAELIGPELQRVLGTQNPGLLSVGLILALWAATGGTNATMKAIDRAYNVAETRPFWKRYLLSMGLTLLTGLVVIAAFLLFVVGEIFGLQIATALGLQQEFYGAVNVIRWVVAFLLALLAAGLLYWRTPNVELPFKWVTAGAVLFGLGWLGATYVFTLYLATFGDYAATYGTLAGVVVLLLWSYLTAFALLLGAELNAVVDEQLDPQAIKEQRRQRSGLHREEP